MNYDHWGPGRTPGSHDGAEELMKGSIRAARERQRMGKSQRIADPGVLLPQTQYVRPNAPGRPQQAPQWMVSEYDNSHNEQQTYAQPQWPLPSPVMSDPRRVPPQRPARGPDVPPIPANLYDNSQVPNPAHSLQRGGKGMSQYMLVLGRLEIMALRFPSRNRTETKPKLAVISLNHEQEPIAICVHLEVIR